MYFRSFFLFSSHNAFSGHSFSSYKSFAYILLFPISCFYWISVCERVCVCAYMCLCFFLTPFPCLFCHILIHLFFILSCIITVIIIDACLFFSRRGEKGCGFQWVRKNGRSGRIEVGETILRIYHMKSLFSIKINKRKYSKEATSLVFGNALIALTPLAQTIKQKNRIYLKS